ncbi:M20 family metallo-hydrolase [Bacillus litorisediminis]|uniref:M20 family metallo-hydrolase n=1 Tax=Bacillus litorisediminis TaxID=2922713 RepID=UPI001FAC1DB2|nr:M20 family metallo-hydrolase [Bacillus litorisediminis]
MKDWLEENLKRLNLVESMEQPDGFTRLGYTESETEAIRVFEKLATDLGLTLRHDAAGNVIARWDGSIPDLPAVSVGSHLDTVASGGGYDGVAGVLCGLGAVKLLQDAGFKPTHPIEVICFRSEESSRFGISTIGSKAMAGLLDLEIGSVKDSEGTTIQEAVEKMGLDWGQFPNAERSRQEIKSFVELHIEQGQILEESGKDFGVVQGIACPIRLKVQAVGQAGHTGTTPMNRRQDALVAVSPLISFVSETAKELSEAGEVPVVATVGTIEAKPNVMTVIPGVVEVGIDIRSVADSLKNEVAERIRRKCEELEKQFQVKFSVSTLVHNPSVLLDPGVQKKLDKAGEDAGFTGMRMNSGAGHDVMNMAAKWPSGLIFIPCKAGLSHHPDEYTTVDDLKMGTEVLASYLRQESGCNE